MSLGTILKRLLGTSSYEAARATYGKEPYLQAQDVSIEERVDAVLDGSVKSLLRDVMGLEELKKLPEPMHAEKFRDLLPVTDVDVRARVRCIGLPPNLARYRHPDGSGDWIFQDDSEWVLSSIDERGMRFDKKFRSKWEAEDELLRAYHGVFGRFLSGRRVEG
jgi:hypothetical protein